MSYASGVQQRRTVDVPRTIFFATLAGVMGWVTNTVIAFVTEWSGRLSWLVVPPAMVLAGVIAALATAKVDTYYPTRSSGRHPQPTPGGAPIPSRARLPFGVSLVVAALVIGVAGLGITVGVRYAVGWMTGDEPGEDRLVRAVTASDEGLSLTVEEVVQTRHFTRVTVRVDSAVPHSITLPVFNNATLVSGRGDAIEADAFRSDWSDSVAPGTTQRGVIVFSGHLADQVTSARLSFATIFGAGFEGPQSMTVPKLRLRPPSS
ncbi:membrane hypothetical protein [metagenome]|uniref:Uncharacterized protein n=1 Tax=metagenome TaxID=256318 RepID=A0A2P2C0K6_9ZZZZ